VLFGGSSKRANLAEPSRMHSAVYGFVLTGFYDVSLMPDSDISIFGIARKTGSHLCNFQGLFILMPIRNTTNSPSNWTDTLVNYFGHTWGAFSI
jgi:hypothetical protein